MEYRGGIADKPLPMTARPLLEGEGRGRSDGGEIVWEVHEVVLMFLAAVTEGHFRKKAEKNPKKIPGVKNHTAFHSEMSADPT